MKQLTDFNKARELVVADVKHAMKYVFDQPGGWGMNIGTINARHQHSSVEDINATLP